MSCSDALSHDGSNRGGVKLQQQIHCCMSEVGVFSHMVTVKPFISSALSLSSWSVFFSVDAAIFCQFSEAFFFFLTLPAASASSSRQVTKPLPIKIRSNLTGSFSPSL